MKKILIISVLVFAFSSSFSNTILEDTKSLIVKLSKDNKLDEKPNDEKSPWCGPCKNKVPFTAPKEK